MKEIIHQEGSFEQGLGNMIKVFSAEQIIRERYAASLKNTRVQVTIKRRFGENSVVNPFPEGVGIVVKTTKTYQSSGQSVGVGSGLKLQYQPYLTCMMICDDRVFCQ
jgi:hypothetical protein